MATTTGGRRRSDILDAVVKVIIDIGFADMTVADVAHAAGVSTALVHYHFTSKPELIEAALHVAAAEDRRFREAIVAEPRSATARLDAVLCGSLPDDASDGSWVLWIEAWSQTRRSPGIRAVMAELDAHEVASIEELLLQGVEAAEFDVTEVHAIATRLTALRDGLAVDRTLLHETIPAEVAKAQMRAALRSDLGLGDEAYLALVSPSR